jgi:hypothetical protein
VLQTRMAKPRRAKETGPRARKASERKLDNLQVRVTPEASEQLQAALPGPSMSDRLRAMLADAVAHHREAVDLCERWTEAQARGDWDMAHRLAAFIAQTYRARTQDLVERLVAVTAGADPPDVNRQEN